MKHATPRTSPPQRAMSPLPVDLARRVTAGLRSPKPERRRQAMAACLAARAFTAGFVQGADSEHARRRHVVDQHHEHWLRGYDAGQRAAAEAAARYLADQLHAPGATLDARAPVPRASGSDAGPRTSPPKRARAIHAIGAQPAPQLTLL